MPFSIRTQSFGDAPITEGSKPYIEYVLKNDDTGEGFTVMPAHGGIVRRLILRKGTNLFSVLNGPDTLQSLIADETYAGALLFPYPSRIEKGIYHFDGEAYALPLNDFGRDNSIHGLVHPKNFKVVNTQASQTEARIDLAYSYTGETNGYPFPFLLEVSYIMAEVEGKPRFDLLYKATNNGITRCPVAFGWHPYFTINNESVDALTISLPVDRAVKLNDKLIPVGVESYTATGSLDLNEQSFDNVFLTADNQNGYVDTVLHSAAQGVSLHIRQETGAGKFNYLVVYTPLKRDSIAIEPLTANANAFNSGEGLTILEPGESITGRISVGIE